MDIISELNIFCSELGEYGGLRQEMKTKDLTKSVKTHTFNLRKLLLKKAGKYRYLITDLTKKEKLNIIDKYGKRNEVDLWFTGLHLNFTSEVYNALIYCWDITTVAIGQLEDEIDKGKRDKETGEKIEKVKLSVSEPPKAFIAHEGMTKTLEKVKDFLNALGVKYLIAEIEPSDGRSAEKQVVWTKGKADFAIILATKGKAINKRTGKHYMGLNVADELGRAREVFKNRIILLLQRGVEPHTNVKEIIYESFTPQNTEKAFIKIAKELTNWGFLKANKLEEQS